jgi:hypothetical protein
MQIADTRARCEVGARIGGALGSHYYSRSHGDHGHRAARHRFDGPTSEVTFGALSQMKRAMANSKIVLWVHTISTELTFQAMGLGVARHSPQDAAHGPVGQASFPLSALPSPSARDQLVDVLSQGLKNKEIDTALLISEGTGSCVICNLD